MFLSEWYELPAADTSDAMGDTFWSTCLAVRQDVNKALFTSCRTARQVDQKVSPMASEVSAAGNSYHSDRNTDAACSPGRFSQISSAVKLKMGAIQRPLDRSHLKFHR